MRKEQARMRSWLPLYLQPAAYLHERLSGIDLIIYTADTMAQLGSVATVGADLRSVCSMLTSIEEL